MAAVSGFRFDLFRLKLRRNVLLLLINSLTLPSLVLAQGLHVPIIVQPAEWTNMPAAAPFGVRTNAPVTFGLGIPDSAQIDCPGTQDKPQNEHAPSKLKLQNESGARLHSQFRCMAKWSDGYAKWVLVDAQLASFADRSPGFDKSMMVIQVASGGGNYPPAGMALQCKGAGTPVATCPDANHIVVTTGTATFLIKEARYNLFDDVLVGSAHIISRSTHGPNDGIYLQGPPDSAIPPTNPNPTIDSASCWSGKSGNSGPLPTNYAGPSICNTAYLSANDSSSICVIEENGPLRSVLMCQGDLDNSNGHAYMHWRTRMHFWANHSDVKVTVALRNADVPSGDCCNPAKMTPTHRWEIAYKEYSQLELRLTDNLGSSPRNFEIANDSNVPTKGIINPSNGSDNAYLFQAYSQNGEWPHWGNAGDCKSEQDGCVVSPIPRARSKGPATYAANGYQISKNGATVTSGGNTQYPVGWADLDDGANGIETGVYQLSMYWPKSLEFQPGTNNHNEIRIGISPNQEEFAGASSTSTYSMGWPQYSIHDTYWNFHAGAQTPALAQNNFLHFQHFLLARPQSGTYYNTAVDAASGSPALFYDIPDPVAEDKYYKSVGVCAAAAGQCLGDVGQETYPYRGKYAGMKVFRYFIWQQAGGGDGTQFEQRESWLRNWLQRGCTPNGNKCETASLTGSLPGRYVFASHWYRMIVEKSLPRSDTATTSGPDAGFRSLCTSEAACSARGFYPWGDPKNHSLPPVWNGGMRNWGDAANSMEHSVYWGAFDYYFLSGDEWVKEQLLQGFKDRYQNPFVAYNNVYAAASGNGAPGHGHITSIRATGHWLSGAARMVEFLRSIGDPDADTPTTVLTSPGTSPGTSTVLQGVEQNLAAQIALPYIASGYPKGWSEPSSVNCQVVSAPSQLCSQGVNPVRGFLRPAGGGFVCGKIEHSVPCDTRPHPADASFQTAIWSEGVYDIWLAMRDLLGKDWHLQVGGINDGAMGPLTVTLSEKNLTDMLYASYQQMSEENCVNTGSYATSGCVYAQFSNYLNSSSGCTSSGDCLRSCVKGCAGLTQWFALAAAAPTTNATVDLAGKSWQFLFESQLKRAGTLNMELGSHMMQFGVNYILADGSSSANNYAVNSTVPVLTQVPINVSPSHCVGPSSGTGTCTITWTQPAGLTAVNGEKYRLKYLPCRAGVLTIYGDDCPADGKTIVATLKFHSDSLTAGFAATDSSGSWEIDPSKSWNWASTTNIPDCSPAKTSPGCNPNVPSGNSYTFITQPNTTYTFSLLAFVSKGAR